jgi:hypothetical protein
MKRLDNASKSREDMPSHHAHPSTAHTLYTGNVDESCNIFHSKNTTQLTHILHKSSPKKKPEYQSMAYQNAFPQPLLLSHAIKKRKEKKEKERERKGAMYTIPVPSLGISNLSVN